MKKRLFSLFLALVMVLGLLPVTALAAGTVVEVKTTKASLTHAEMYDALAGAFGTSTYTDPDTGEQYTMPTIQQALYEYRYAPVGTDESTGTWYNFDSTGSLNADGTTVYVLQSKSAYTSWSEMGTFVLKQVESKVTLNSAPIYIYVKSGFLGLDWDGVTQRLFNALVNTELSDADVTLNNVQFYCYVNSSNLGYQRITDSGSFGLIGKNTTDNAKEPIYVYYDEVYYGPVMVTFVANEYTITYTDGVNGAAFINQAYTVAENTQTPAFDGVPEYTGHVFLGWDSNGNGTADSTSGTVSANVTYTALWAPYLTVTWMNGSETLESDRGILASENAAPTYNAETPTKEFASTDAKYYTHYYNFIGWNTSASATEALDLSTMTVDQNMTFYAVFEEVEREYTVKWVNDDGTVLYSMDKDADGNPLYYGDYDYTGDAPESSDESKAFAGTWTKSVTIDPNVITYTADYGQLYKATWDFEGTENDVVEYIAAGATLTAPAAPEKEGNSWVWDNYTAGMSMPAQDTVFTGEYVAGTYTITWLVDGEEYHKVTAACGTDVEAPATPTETGYTFSGWDKTAPATMPAEDMVISGTFTVNQYTIIWNIDDKKTEQTYDFGATIVAPTATKEGHGFTGWQANNSDAAYATVPATMPACDLEYTALFEAGTHTVYWKLDDGSTYESETYKYGETIAVPATEPSKEGHSFASWTGYTEGMTMLDADQTFTAQWTVNSYTITWVIDNETYGTVPYKFGAAITAPTPAKEGYTFGGWQNVPATMPAEDITVNGSWSTNGYTVTWTVDGVEYDSVEIAYGADIPVKAEPTKEGYTFSGWSEAPETMPAKDVVIEGTFSVNSYTVTWTVDGEEYETKSVEFGAAIPSVDDPTKEFYTFAGWNGVPTTMPAVDVTITAEFKPVNYTITFVVDGNETTQSVWVGDIANANVETYLDDSAFDTQTDSRILLGWATTNVATEAEYEVGCELADVIFTDGKVTLYPIWTPDVNNSGIVDKDEKVVITVYVTGNGTVEITTPEKAERIDNTDDGVYEYLLNFKDGYFNAKFIYTLTPADGEYIEKVEGVAVKDGVYYEITDGGTSEVHVYFASMSITAEDAKTEVTSDDINNSTDLVGLIKELTFVSAEPEAIASGIKTLYLAREEGTTVKVDLPADYTSYASVLAQFGITFPYYLPLDEVWLEVGADLPAAVAPETAINEVIEDVKSGKVAMNEDAVKAALLAKLAGNGVTVFGANTAGTETYVETVKYSYTDGDKTIYSNEAKITIKESRADTEISTSADSYEFIYGDYESMDEFLAAIDAKVMSKGAELENADIDYNVDVTKAAGEYTLTLKYAETLKFAASEKTITVTVNKALAEIDIASQAVKYTGKPVSNLVVANCETINFIVGIDGHDETYVLGMAQVAIPEALYTALDAYYDFDLNDLTIDQVKQILSDAEKLGNAQVSSVVSKLAQYKDEIEQLVGALQKVQAELNQYTTTELRISIVKEMTVPTNVGIYVVGAIVSDSNYYIDSQEESMAAGYLIITPDGTKTSLAWNEPDDNYIITLDKLNDSNLGATADIAAAQKYVEYLFVGVDNDGELLLNRVRTTEDVNKVVTQVGVYAQVAYVADWGNEMYYALPIARPVIVSPNVADVKILDDKGNENYAQVYTYTGKPVGTTITVDGKAAPVDGLKIKYIGSDTTADGWYRTEAPTDAGVYTVVAIYTETDDQGDLSKAGGAVGVIIIEPADADVGLNDVNCAEPGTEQFADITNKDLDYITIAIDRDANTAYVNLPADITAHAERIVGYLPAEVETEVKALLDKYAKLEGSVTTDGIEAELEGIMDKLIAVDMTETAYAKAKETVELLKNELTTNEDIQALASKIKDEVAKIEAKVTEKLSEEYAEKIAAYLKKIYEKGDINVDEIKATLESEIDTLVEKYPELKAVAGVLYLMSEDITTAIKNNDEIDQVIAEIETIIAKVKALGLDDAEAIATKLVGYMAEQIDTEQIKELLNEVVSKVENLGYVEYAKKLLSDMSEMYPVDVDVDTYVANAKTQLNKLVDAAKAAVKSGELKEADLDTIEGYVDSILGQLKAIIDEIPEGYTVVFGSNPTEEGKYDCYAMNISANYKPEFVSATLTIGHTPGEEATCTDPQTCTVCGEELAPSKGHTPGAAVKENVVEATSSKPGSYDSVVYCEICGEELSRETITVSATGVNISFTAISWDDEDNAIALLYSAELTDAEIRADVSLEAPTKALEYVATKGDITANADGKRYDQTFSFEGLPAGTYKLAIFKEGKYVPKVIEITITEDGDLGATKLWLYGDVNYNGKIQANDAGQISNSINFAASAFDLADTEGDLGDDTIDRVLAADVNCDNKVQANDAGQISNYINFAASVFDYFR